MERQVVCQDACMAAWRSFVAVGDSFSEGLDDPSPDGMGYRGWADLVAARLAVDVRDFRYANLAIRGRLFGNIVDEQVPLALAMKPDLVSFAAGGNDVLRRNFDPDALIARFDRTIEQFREASADVVVFRFADLTRRLPGRKMILPRVHRLNRGVEETARRHGAHMVDLWHDDEFGNPRLWSVDRLHLSTAGHQRVAGHVLRVLGLAADPEWLAAVPRPEALSWVASKAADVRWARQHLAPWLKRRLTGKSSGDLITAKRPELSRLD
jgi:lysophospholipase L1-like esterase